MSNGYGRWIAFISVVALAVVGVYRVESIANDAKDLAEQNRALIKHIRANTRANERESKARINQSCELFERDHKTDVEEYANEIRSLKVTIGFLDGLTLEQAQEPLNSLIARELPEARKRYRKERAEALVDAAPDYCDKPGVRAERLYEQTGGRKGAPPVGLPEPDPVLPDDPFLKRP